jgi:soluble lytic murein transglycosylase-like protein
MRRRVANSACLTLATLGLFAQPVRAQIARVKDDSGRQFFVNAEPKPEPRAISKHGAKIATGTSTGGFSMASAVGNFASQANKGTAASNSRATIYLPAESSFTGGERPAMSIDHDGVEKLVREAAERHRIDPALVRAVIETESNWNPAAVSRKGAFGLMQLIPTTAQRFGVNDAFNPQQNVDAGVRYLKTLLERYNGNLDLALAAYNAGEGAVDRAHGVPSIRETREYVQKVQNAYFRPGSGRIDGLWVNPRGIRKDTTADGRTIFTND